MTTSVQDLGNNEYRNRHRFQQLVLNLRLPTIITPRYIPRKATKLFIEKNQEENQHEQINRYSDWGTNTGIVLDVANITPPQTHIKNTQTPNNLSLKLIFHEGIKLERIHSGTHKLLIKNTGNSQQIDGEKSPAFLSTQSQTMDC